MKNQNPNRRRGGLARARNLTSVQKRDIARLGGIAKANKYGRRQVRRNK